MQYVLGLGSMRWSKALWFMEDNNQGNVPQDLDTYGGIQCMACVNAIMIVGILCNILLPLLPRLYSTALY